MPTHWIEFPLSSDGSAKYRLNADTVEQLLTELACVHDAIGRICAFGAGIVSATCGGPEGKEREVAP